MTCFKKINKTTVFLSSYSQYCDFKQRLRFGPEHYVSEDGEVYSRGGGIQSG